MYFLFYFGHQCFLKFPNEIKLRVTEKQFKTHNSKRNKKKGGKKTINDNKTKKSMKTDQQEQFCTV